MQTIEAITTQPKEPEGSALTQKPQKPLKTAKAVPKGGGSATTKDTRPCVGAPTVKKEPSSSMSSNKSASGKGALNSATTHSHSSSGATSKNPLKPGTASTCKAITKPPKDVIEQDYSSYRKENIELRKQRKNLEDESFNQRNEIQKLRHTLDARADSRNHFKREMQEVVREDITSKFTSLIGICLNIEKNGQDCSREVLVLKDQIGMLENRVADMTSQIDHLKQDVGQLKESVIQNMGQRKECSCQGPEACNVIERILNGFLVKITKTLESGKRKMSTDESDDINWSDEDNSFNVDSSSSDTNASDYVTDRNHRQSRSSTGWKRVKSASRERNNIHPKEVFKGQPRERQITCNPKPGNLPRVDTSEVQTFIPRRPGLRPRVNQKRCMPCDSGISTLVPPPPRSFHGYGLRR